MSSLQRLIDTKSQRKISRTLWFERIMAILALLNLILVFFDLTYVPLRNFWLHRRIQVFSFEIGPFESEGFPVPIPIPDITPLYDPIKGIEPYRDTQLYLETVNELQQELKLPQELITGGLRSPEVEQQLLVKLREDLRSPEVEVLLAELRDRSEDMIDTNPFQVAEKTGTLERIKNRIRAEVPNEEDSAKEAFLQFWSEDYLAENPLQKLNFFNEEIKPLLETNYYRPIGETGDFVNYFGVIDFPFFALFATEFLARTWFISRRRTGVSWLDAMLWRWYDIFLLIPLWRWLRIIPVTIRLDQAKLIDLSAIQKQARQGFVAEIAGEMTQVVVIQVISEVQRSIRQGEFANWLTQREVRPYIDINNTDEVATLTKLVMQMTVYEVLPKIRPDVEALLEHNLQKILNQSPAYQRLEQLPGLGAFGNQLTERLVKEITQALYDGLHKAFEEDPAGDQLLQQLIKHLGEAYGTQIQAAKTLTEIQSLLTDLLEEVKINYVERLSEEDLEEILEQTRALRQIAQR
ncbi:MULTISPECIES: hypothetical protein [unclassified Coleofasciculus]|uniref:hypothetical protein n=1 Tax=unclassified Coleofasciculus TaxID=2692782 RepID=UPI00187EFCF8|nr:MULTISPECIES: hypothetical protein [unclassified Coleofasciculus]MBE9124793.1 hypothetical protein [Coleofasciculus sp. LEGE 07081]MBE9147698.1 hypothetical protein [Coleofasciculus sp. LEGE 07092]